MTGVHGHAIDSTVTSRVRGLQKPASSQCHELGVNGRRCFGQFSRVFATGAHHANHKVVTLTLPRGGVHSATARHHNGDSTVCGSIRRNWRQCTATQRSDVHNVAPEQNRNGCSNNFAPHHPLEQSQVAPRPTNLVRPCFDGLFRQNAHDARGLWQQHGPTIRACTVMATIPYMRIERTGAWRHNSDWMVVGSNPNTKQCDGSRHVLGCFGPLCVCGGC